jgi:hypothetical protein
MWFTRRPATRVPATPCGLLNASAHRGCGLEDVVLGGSARGMWFGQRRFQGDMGLSQRPSRGCGLENVAHGSSTLAMWLTRRRLPVSRPPHVVCATRLLTSVWLRERRSWLVESGRVAYTTRASRVPATQRGLLNAPACLGCGLENVVLGGSARVMWFGQRRSRGDMGLT